MTLRLALSILCLLPAPDQELEKARADLKKALSELRPLEVRDAADRLAATNQKTALDALLDGYGKCAQAIKGLWGDKTKYLADREANGDFKIDFRTNPPSIVRSDIPKYERYLEADKLSKATEAKIMGIEASKRWIVLAMGRFRSDASVKNLVHEVSAGADWQRRAAAAEALGQIEHKEALPALIDALKGEKEPAVRVALVEALRAQKNPAPEVVAALAAQLQSEYWQLKSTAAFALKSLGAKEGIEALIEALPKSDGRMRADLNEALVGLTGTDKHGDYAAWKGWWEANREAVAKGTYRAAEGDGSASSGKNATTSFYGIPVESKCVIFVLDRSGSMVEPSDWEAPKETQTGAGNEPGGDVKKAGDRKIDIARWQMKKCIAQMPEGAEFNVIFFSHEFVLLSDKMLRISAQTRKQAFDWIDRLEPFGGTNTFDALEKALSYASTGTAGEKLQKAGVDTIFLMTDGLPNSGQVPEAKDILVRIRELNKTRKVRIHTVGVFTVSSGANAKQELKEKEEGTKFLKQLAEDNAGRFTGSGQPPKPDAKPEPPKKSP